MSERAAKLLASLAALALLGQVAFVARAQEEREEPEEREVTSNAGAWIVRWRSEPAEIPLGAPFDLELEARSAREREPRHPLELSFDARMPEHRHGMRVRPSVESLGAGRWRVRGARLHMPGAWELHFDLCEGAITERAQVRVELE